MYTASRVPNDRASLLACVIKMPVQTHTSLIRQIHLEQQGFPPSSEGGEPE